LPPATQLLNYPKLFYHYEDRKPYVYSLWRVTTNSVILLRGTDIPAIRSSGLGLATASKLYENGAYIAILDLQEVPEAARESLKARSRYFKTDLTNDSQIENAVAQAVKWTKDTNAPLGGVVNCGGIAAAQKVSVMDVAAHDIGTTDY
jgi:NADP-dependent 3-hydroxy acid dehydrogenase YdfG